MDIKNLEEGYELICAEFPDCQVSKVHGKMKPAEKDAEMQRLSVVKPRLWWPLQ